MSIGRVIVEHIERLLNIEHTYYTFYDSEGERNMTEVILLLRYIMNADVVKLIVKHHITFPDYKNYLGRMKGDITQRLFSTNVSLAFRCKSRHSPGVCTASWINDIVPELFLTIFQLSLIQTYKCTKGRREIGLVMGLDPYDKKGRVYTASMKFDVFKSMEKDVVLLSELLVC